MINKDVKAKYIEGKFDVDRNVGGSFNHQI